MWLVVTAIEHPQQTSRRGRHNTIWFRVYDPIFVVGLYETLSKELQLLEFNFSLWQMLTAMYVYMKYCANQGVFQASLWAEPNQNTVCPWQLYKKYWNARISFSIGLTLS